MELRERILDAALASFLSVGYTATTADAIAKQLQISKKTLYKVIPSKEQLMRESVSHLIQQLDKGLNEVYHDPTLSYRDRVIAHMDFVMRQYLRLGSTGVLPDLRRAIPDAWTSFDAWAEQRRSKFRTMLEEGVRSGHLSSTIPIDLMLRVYASFMDNFVQFSSRLRQGMSPATLFMGFMEMYYHGIVADPAAGERT
jgi:AcrR family transcriptional regulator